MLHSKIIKCPKTPEDVGAAMQPIAEMAIDYGIELGIGRAGFDVGGFAAAWMEGTQHLMGFYEGDELVGFVIARTEGKAFSDVKTLAVQSIYIRREHRQEGTTHVDAAVVAGKAYAKSLGLDGMMIYADFSMMGYLQTQGGRAASAIMEFDI